MSQPTGLIRLPAGGAKSSLAAWLTGDLAGAVARIYITDVQYDPENPLYLYDEAAFAGYAPQALSPWIGPVDQGAGVYRLDATPSVWEWLLDAGSVDCYGIYVTDAANTKLLLVMPFIRVFTLSPRNRNLIQQVQLLQRSQI